MELAVVVIGSGAAGALAGLAARRAGAKVTLISRAQGATAMSSGAIGFGVASDHRGKALPLLEAAHAIANAHPHHPYALLGQDLDDAVSDAWDFVCRELASLNVQGPATGDSGLRSPAPNAKGSGVEAGGEGEHPELRLITSIGAVLRTTLAQGAIARGDLSRIPAGTRIAVLGVEGFGAFDPWLVVSGLREAGFDAVPVSARVSMEPQDSLADLARLIDGDSRDALVAKTAAACHAANARFAFVPTAGLRDPESFCDALCESGLDGAAEIVGLLPSLPGLRLQRALDSSLEEAGVHRIHANVDSVERARVGESGAVGGVEAGGGAESGDGPESEDEPEPGDGSDSEDVGGSGAVANIRSVLLDNGERIAADVLVLASGRFISGGIRHDGRFVEPLLGLPVYVDGDEPGDRWVGDLLDRHPHASQPALRAGVRVDSHMRPLDERGRCAVKNLFAVGSVIGGYDLTQDSTGLGVAAVTAMRAAQRIAALARNRE